MFWSKKSTKGSKVNENTNASLLRAASFPIDHWQRDLHLGLEDNTVIPDTLTDVVASAISTLKLHHLDDNGERVENSFYEQLLANPSPLQTSEQFLYQLVDDTIRLGNGLVLKKVGQNFKPTALYVVRGNPSGINSDGSNVIYDSLVNPLLNETSTEPISSRLVGNVMFRQRSDMPLVGTPLAEGLEQELGLYAALQSNASAYHKYAASNTDLTISTDLTLTSSQSDELRKRAREATAYDSQGGLLVLTSGLHLERVPGRDLTKEGIIELSNAAAKTIAARWRVPASMIGILDNASGYKSISDMENSFYNNNLSHYLHVIESALQKLLGVRLRFDLSEFETTQPSLFEKAQATQMLHGSGILSANECRQMLGFEPLEDDLQAQKGAGVGTDTLIA